MSDRKALLVKLIKMNEPINDGFLKELESFGWDSEEELVILKKMDILNILSKYLNNGLEEAEIENWANHIESRDDIGFEENSKILIKNILFELANPLLTVKLSKERAKILIEKLTSNYRINGS